MSENETPEQPDSTQAEIDRSPEDIEPNSQEYPKGYFDAQVRFAQKWSELTGEDLSQVLLTKTALYRRIWEQRAPEGQIPDNWTDLLGGLSDDPRDEDITDVLYRAYTDQPHSEYVPPEGSSAFGYDYLPDKHTVKIHFTNLERGDSPFSQANMPKRQEELKHLLQEVAVNHPDAETLVSASWIRSTDSYRSLSPPDIAEQQSLMATDMAFDGNSLWGQFIDRHGNTNQRVYDQFIEAVGRAENLDELMAAFPYQVLKAEDSITKYYNYYGVETPRT